MVHVPQVMHVLGLIKMPSTLAAAPATWTILVPFWNQSVPIQQLGPILVQLTIPATAQRLIKLVTTVVPPKNLAAGENSTSVIVAIIKATRIPKHNYPVPSDYK